MIQRRIRRMKDFFKGKNSFVLHFELEFIGVYSQHTFVYFLKKETGLLFFCASPSPPLAPSPINTFAERIKILTNKWGKMSLTTTKTIIYLSTLSDYSLLVNKTLGFSNQKLTRESGSYSNSLTIPSFWLNVNQCLLRSA